MLLVCIRTYLKSVLRCKFSVLGTCHLDTIHLHKQGYDYAILFFKAKRGTREKKDCESLMKIINEASTYVWN